MTTHKPCKSAAKKMERKARALAADNTTDDNAVVASKKRKSGALDSPEAGSPPEGARIFRRFGKTAVARETAAREARRSRDTTGSPSTAAVSASEQEVSDGIIVHPSTTPSHAGEVEKDIPAVETAGSPARVTSDN